MIPIHIPTPLRSYAGRNAVVEVEAQTVGDALRALVDRHDELRRHLYDDAGGLRRYVNVYLNDEDIRYLGREGTPVADGDTISIIPSIAGGAPGPPAWATGADGLPPMNRTSCCATAAT
jgi:adenylyltransferase/sulfurtransferase